MQFPERPPKGKRVPFQDVKLGCCFRLAPQGESVSHFAVSCQDAAARNLSAGISPDKTCQNKPVPFWQVLEADGEGDLMVMAGYGSGAAVGLGDGAHDG